jgi:uncharacterized protein YjbI with pentapeptide repeats
MKAICKFWRLFYDPNSRDFALETVKAVISFFGLFATVVAGVGLYLTYQGGQERLITERFSKGVEQLGNQQTTVRIGGIYTLERIAKDSAKDHWTIMEVLSSFIREKSLLLGVCRSKKLEEESVPKVGVDVRAALSVIKRRDAQRSNLMGLFPKNLEKNLSLDLSCAYIRETDLREAVLERANLEGANIEKANLERANLEGANLWGVNLKRANLRGVTFKKANLGGADLQGAVLEMANLQGTNLQGANLMAANLEEANFHNTDLEETNIEKANIEKTDFRQVKNLIPTKIKSACNWQQAIYQEGKDVNQKFIEKLKNDTSSDPQKPVNCWLWKGKSAP